MHTNVAKHDSLGEGVRERPLGPLEQWFYVMDQHRANHFSMAVAVTSEISHEECVLALAKLPLRHPLLSAFIEGHTGTAPSFKSVDEPAVPLRVSSRKGPDSWKAELEKEMTVPMDTAIAPLMRAVLLSGDNRSELIFTIHHSVTDATGLLFVIRDFFDVLSGGDIQSLRFPNSIESVREELGLASPVGIGHEPGATTLVQPLSYRPPANTVRISVMSLTEAQTIQIAHAARLQGVTVHAALTAALVIGGRQLSSSWRSGPVRVFSPINLREDLGVDEGAALVLGAGVVHFEVGVSQIWDFARQGLKDLASFRTPESNFFLGEVLGKVGASPDTAATIVAEHFGYELMLSNLGRIRLDLGTDRLTVTDIWGPAVTFGFDQEQSVAALSFKGALHLTHTSPAPIEGLLAKAVELLLASSI